MQQQIDTIKTDHSKGHDEQVQSLQQQLDQLRQQYDGERSTANAHAAEWDKQRKQLEVELAAARSGAQGAGESAKELATLRAENKQLEAWLAEAEEKAKKAPSGGGGQEMDDLR